MLLMTIIGYFHINIYNINGRVQFQFPLRNLLFARRSAASFYSNIWILEHVPDELDSLKAQPTDTERLDL